VRLGRIGFGALLVAALAVTLTFLTLPIVAIFAEVPPGHLLDGLRSDVARDALKVTLKTNLIANALILLVGTPAAYLLGTRSFRGRSVVLTLIELPLVLPPAVAGIGLIAAFGSLGLVGEHVEAAQVSVGTQTAVVMAVAFVAGPFYVRPAVAAFAAVDRNLLDAARTLGAGPARVFAAVAVPLAGAGLGAGAALAFARGLGEFGATIMFAGSLQGVTQTLSLAVYEQFDVDFDTALAIGSLLIAVSGALLLAVKLVPRWTRSLSLSPTVSAASSST
jgi:molybdate transport system permease protein